MTEMNGDPIATAKLAVHEFGGTAYSHAIETAAKFAQAGNYGSASFWRKVAGHIGAKSHATLADVAELHNQWLRKEHGGRTN
jgi:predicted TIM-barrel enzyme